MASYLGDAVMAVAWVFGGLATVVVAARFYVCLRVMRKVSVDDYIVLLTLLLGIGNNVCLTLSWSWGLGTHIEFLAAEPVRIMYTVKWVYLCEFFSIMCPGTGRISYALLLLRIIPPSKTRRRFLWSIIWIQFIVDVVTVAVSFCQCRPIQGFWDRTVEASCWAPEVQQYVGFFQGSVCSAVDLGLAVFPASMFWNLKMELSQKLKLSAIMGLGVIAMVASIIKTVKLQAITSTGDLTYAMAELAIWWTIEAYLVLLAVSMPSLRPVLKSKKGTSRAATAGDSRKGSSFHSSWRRIGSSNAADRGSLQGYTELDRIKQDSSSRTTETDPTNGSHSDDSWIRLEDGDGIRKAVTVSVTYGDRKNNDIFRKPPGPGEE